MRSLPRALPLVPVVILAACGEEAPIWDDIPPVQLEVGGQASLDLDDYVEDPDGSDELLLITVYGGGAASISASIDASTHIVTFTGARTFEGGEVFEIVATDPDGNATSTLLAVSAGDVVVPGDVPQRSCLTSFSYSGVASTVAVAGEFNGWSTTADPLSDPDGDGVYTAAVDIPAGHWQYKLVLGGSQWILDPDNPYQAWDGGFVNSAVVVPDCALPEVEVVDLAVAGGRLRGTLQYYRGEGQASMPSASPFKVTVAGAAVNVTVDADTGRGTFEVPAVASGKYTTRAWARRGDGALGQAVTRPLWVEDRPFDWREAVMYFAMTDRFLDGTASGDGAVPGVADIANYDGGDWAGIAEKIDEGYFTDLGVDVIWISPIRDNPAHAEYGADGRQYTGYHGYWPTSSSVEGHFGGDAALRDLVSAAHDRGIRIMLDLVANHVHDEHPWASEHPDWFNDFDWCGDGGSWDNNPIGCWFMDYLPDLDFQNDDALFAQLDVSMALIEDYDLDAVRLDAVKHMEQVFERDLVAMIEDRLETTGAEVYTVGETFTGPWDQAGYNQGLIQEHVGDGLLDGQFDFPLYWEVISTFARDEQGMDALASMLSASEGYYGPGALMSNFLGNHDVPRFISHANGDIGDKWGNGAQEQGWTNPPAQPTAAAPYQRLRLAYTFLMTTEGVPLIYYGDEIGLAGAGDPDNRRPMPWSGLSAEQEATRAHIAALTAIRRDHPSLSRGSRQPLMADGTAMAYGRVLPTDRAVVALNRAATPRTLNLNLSGMGLAAGTTLVDVLSGAQATVSGGSITVTVGGRAGAIFVPQ